MSRKYDVTLCGYYGFGNLGDELLARSLIGLLEESGIERDRIALLSADPVESSGELGVDCYYRWNPWTVWRVLKRSKSLLFGGGGIFQDSSSIRSCFYYWAVAELAVIAGARLWMFGQSIGPLKTTTAKILTKSAVSKCVVRGVRDQGSTEILSDWKLSSFSSPDPVLSIKPGCDDKEAALSDRKLLVNLRPWGNGLPWKLMDELKKIDARQFDEIVFAALAEEDETLARELLEGSPMTGIRTRVERVKTMGDIDRLWCAASAAVGMRLHFCILSYVFCVPCVSVPYDPKVSYFSGEWGLSTWMPGSVFPELPLKSEATLCENSEVREQLKREIDRCLGIVLGAS